MTLAAFLTPGGAVALVLWNFAVLAAAQLTIRLIMAFSIRTTVAGTVALTALSYPVAWVYDVLVGADPGFSARLNWAPVVMLLMAGAGFVVARWVLRIKRLRGQLIAGGMVAVLAPHLFTLALPLI